MADSKPASDATAATEAVAHDDHAHHGDMEPTYYKVFGALVVCTAVSFITVTDAWIHSIGAGAGHTVVMIVAVIKALLVALFFMHLKYDWGKLYFMFVPTLTIATLLPCVLLPDITFSQTRIVNYNKEADGARQLPPAARINE